MRFKTHRDVELEAALADHCRVTNNDDAAEPLPPFDPKSKCTKCGWSIPDPVAPPPKVIAGGAVAKPAPGQKPGEEKAFIFEIPADFALPTAFEVREMLAAETPAKKPAAKPAAAPAEKKEPTGSLYQPPPPPPQPPTVFYCNGLECPWEEPGVQVDEHMHQCCDVCGFEWIALPLDAT